MLYNLYMQKENVLISNRVPERLRSYFQEYDLDRLDSKRDANLIIQRVLEFGNWEEIHWLFEFYGTARVRRFVRGLGERSLKPVTFNYWRQLLRIRRWESSPFPTPVGIWIN